jgi:hypothetical protein
MIDTEKLTDLESLSCDLDTADEFNTTYEKLLIECRANGNRQMILELQKLAFSQFMWAAGVWMQEYKQVPVS